MLESLKQEVFEANIELQKKGLIIYTWGNASGIDSSRNYIVIKPSGIPYEKLKPDDMVVIDMEGNTIEGRLKPSSDTPTILVMFKTFKQAGGIVHTHSTWASIWAQAGKGIPCFGTTHADYFYGEVPCTREMTTEEIKQSYEMKTGEVITETFKNIDPGLMPAVLVNNHGVFTWGKDVGEAVHNAVVLEEVAKMAHHSLLINPNLKPISQPLLDKHFLRKHGKTAYYGQE